jgi:sugar lactone lactonase YvrE
MRKGTVRKVVVASRNVTTVAGNNWATQDGVGSNAAFDEPTGLAITPDATTAYVADIRGNRIRQVDIASGTVTTIAGSNVITNLVSGSNAGNTDGIGTATQFDRPSGLAMSQGGFLYMTDSANNRVRRYEVATRLVSTLPALL